MFPIWRYTRAITKTHGISAYRMLLWSKMIFFFTYLVSITFLTCARKLKKHLFSSCKARNMAEKLCRLGENPELSPPLNPWSFDPQPWLWFGTDGSLQETQRTKRKWFQETRGEGWGPPDVLNGMDWLEHLHRQMDSNRLEYRLSWRFTAWCCQCFCMEGLKLRFLNTLGLKWSS